MTTTGLQGLGETTSCSSFNYICFNEKSKISVQKVWPCRDLRAADHTLKMGACGPGRTIGRVTMVRPSTAFPNSRRKGPRKPGSAHSFASPLFFFFFFALTPILGALPPSEHRVPCFKREPSFPGPLEC